MPRKVFTDFDFQGVSKPVNLPSPSDPGDATSKGYVDSLIEGLGWKDNCRVATQGNINLSSPGATVDGVTMAPQDRVLVRLQTAAADNGIYVWNGATVPMTRSLDANTFAELKQAVAFIDEGSSAGAGYRQDQVNGTLGSSSINWVSFGAIVPDASETTAGKAEIATQAETDAGTDDSRIVTPAKLANWSGRLRKVAANIGDGSATSYTVTHNLNTRDVIVRVFPNSGQYDDVEVDVQRTSVNAATLVFATAPAADAYRVVVIG